MSNLRDPRHFLFSTLPGKGGKRSEIFGNKGDGHWCCRILISFELFDYLLPSARFDVWSFLEIVSLQKWIFCKFWPWPTFQKSSVTRIRWPDTLRSSWRKSDENRLNGVGDVQSCFSVFQGATFPTGKWRPLCCNLHSRCTYFFVFPSSLIIFIKQISTGSNSYSDTCLGVFSIPRGKGSTVLERKNLVLSPAQQIEEDPFEFWDYIL